MAQLCEAVPMASEQTTAGTDGTTLSWTRSGDGKPVVLVHGITENREVWDPIVGRLHDRFTVITVDLRGHGRSGMADDYGLAAMTGDIIGVIADAGIERPHLVGHSLGGAVVSAVGSVVPVESVINVDQSLRLGGFKEMLEAVEPMLRDEEGFSSVMATLFADLMGEMLSDQEKNRLTDLRCFSQSVVLGVWAEMFSSAPEEIDAVVDAALAGYAESPVRYLSLFGVDPGDDYTAWLEARIPGAECDVWSGHGHYPHLVDPDRFVAEITAFWA